MPRASSQPSALPSHVPVLVVGAGIAGLAAAHTLRAAGIASLVLECEPYVGGRMSSEHVDGYVIDRGAYTIGGYATNTLALAHEVAGPGAVSPISPWQGLYREGRIHRYRGDSLFGMAKHSGISLGSRIILAHMFLSARRNRQHLRLHAPDAVTHQLDNDSVTSYLLRAAGEEVLEYVAYPITSVLYISEPEETSRVAFLATLLYLRGLELYNSPDGIGFLAEALASGLDVRLGTEVREIRAAEGTWVAGENAGGLATDVAGGSGVWGPAMVTLEDGSRIEAGAVILTVPAAQVAALVPELPTAAVDALREVPYGASTPVALALGRPMSEPAFVVNLPRTECRNVAALTFEHNKHPARVPEGHCLLMAYPGAEAGARLIQAGDDRVVQVVLHDLEKLYPRLSSQVESARVYRWPYAAAGLRPGDLARRAQLRAALPSNGPVFFAGDYLYTSSSIEGSLVSGLKAAARVQRYLSEPG